MLIIHIYYSSHCIIIYIIYILNNYTYIRILLNYTHLIIIKNLIKSYILSYNSYKRVYIVYVYTHLYCDCVLNCVLYARAPALVRSASQCQCSRRQRPESDTERERAFYGAHLFVGVPSSQYSGYTSPTNTTRPASCAYVRACVGCRAAESIRLLLNEHESCFIYVYIQTYNDIKIHTADRPQPGPQKKPSYTYAYAAGTTNKHIPNPNCCGLAQTYIHVHAGKTAQPRQTASIPWC